MVTNAVHIKQGAEGPRHDPYAFTEVTIEARVGRVTYHGGGLVEWCEVAGGRVNGERARAFFTNAVGMTPEAIETAHYRAKDRRIKAHLRACGGCPADASGYPGESFLVCSKCGDVLDSHFDRSAIE